MPRMSTSVSATSDRPRRRLAPAVPAALCTLLLLVPALATAQAAEMQDGEGQQEQPPGVGDEYRIGPRDLLEVRVFDLDDLNTEARVSEAGTITLPLVGELSVSGLTRSEAEGRIETALVRYVNEPQVFVFVREYQSQRFSIMGAVNTPGTYDMEGRTSLLEAISMAGGVNFSDASGKIIVIRQGFTQEPIEISMQELIDRGNTAFNIDLEARDVINVEPKRSYFIYVYGQVNGPGQFELKGPITLLQAISLAGGLAERAAEDRVRIMRTRLDGKQEVFEVNLEEIEDGEIADIPLNPGDIVLVPSTFF